MCIFLLKGVWDRLNGGSSSRSTGNFAIVAAKLESTAQCGKIPVPPHYRTAQNKPVVAN